MIAKQKTIEDVRQELAALAREVRGMSDLLADATLRAEASEARRRAVAKTALEFIEGKGWRQADVVALLRKEVEG